LGYTNALCTIFPGLPSKSNLLIIISSECPKIICNAITLLSSFQGFSIIEVNVDYNDQQNFILSVKPPLVGWISKVEGISPEVVDCYSIVFPKESIYPQLLMENIRAQVPESGLHGFLSLSEDFGENTSNCILSLYTINPFLLLKSIIDQVDVSVLTQILGLSEESEISDISHELDKIALEWSENVRLTFSDYINVLRTFNIKLDFPRKDNNLKHFIKLSHSNRVMIWIDFFGFLSNYFFSWIKNEKNRELLTSLGFDSNGWKNYSFIYGAPIIKILALSDLFQISEFRREIITAHDVFAHGRKWGKITNIALLGNENEYSAELPFFFIGFARAPFKVPIILNEKTMAKSGELFVEGLTKVLSDRGNPILGHLFLLGYVAESTYYRPKSAKDKDIYVPTNIKTIGNNLIDLTKQFEFTDLSYEVSNLVKNITERQVDLNRLPEIEKFIEGFEQFLKYERDLNKIGWLYRTGPSKWHSNLKTMIKHLISDYKSKFKYPVIVVLPNGDYGVNDLNDINNSEPLIKMWEEMDKNEYFMVIDLGESAGVVRIIPFGNGDNFGKIVDKRDLKYNPKGNEKIICPYWKSDFKKWKCVLSDNDCPIDCLLDPPEFELFFKNCELNKENKKSILKDIFKNQ